MNELDVLPKTCVQIYQSDNYHGSGVLVEAGGVFYVFSAAHVISQDITKLLTIEGFYGVSEKYGKIEFGTLIGEHEARQKFDIAGACKQFCVTAKFKRSLSSGLRTQS